jgi:hypothetical protein
VKKPTPIKEDTMRGSSRHYWITEWDGELSLVSVSRVDSEIEKEEVYMRYPDGETHRVSAKYFSSLSPRLVGFKEVKPN